MDLFKRARTDQEFISFCLFCVFCVTVLSFVIAPSESRASEPRGEKTQLTMDLPENASIDDLVEYALANNPGLQASQAHWRSSKEAIGAARALPDPHVSYGHYLEAVETRVGPQRRSFGISQTIPWIQKLRLRREVAEFSATVAGKKLEIDEQKLRFLVKETFYQLLYISEAIDLAEENLEWVRQFESIARARYTSGGGTQISTLSIQMEYETLQDQYASLNDKRRITAIHLNTLLSRPLNAELPNLIPTPLDDFESSEEDLLLWVRKENPSLQALQLTAKREDSVSRLAQKAYLPDLTFGFKYIMTDESENPALADSGKDPIILNLSINLPIWFGQYRAAKESARQRKEAALYTHADLENHLSAELEEVLSDLRDAERRMDLYNRKLIPLAEQSQDVTLQAFSTGELSFAELIEAQRQILDMKLGSIRALTDRRQSLSRIEWLIGNNLSGVEE